MHTLYNSVSLAWMNGFTAVLQYQLSCGKTKTYYVDIKGYSSKNWSHGW